MPKRLIERRWPWWTAAGAILVVFASTFVAIPRSRGWDPRPRGSLDDIERLRERRDLNVMFILIDMLRADRLGSYGYARNTSPTLDRLAHSGVRFAHHLSQSSWTKASMASLWTALHPARTGVLRFNHVIPDEAQLASEVLAAAGLQTVGLYRNGWVAPTFGFAQGFAAYQRPTAQPLPPDVKIANPTLIDRATDASLIEAALEFLRVDGRKPWFLYLHFMDLHEYLYDEGSALFGSSHSDIYDNSIRHTDDLIGALLAHLYDQGYGENTVLVVTSDHGEAFGEHGYDGHAREVYRETTEVPWIVSLPFRLDPGLTVETRTSNVDLWPTVLDLIGLAWTEERDGRSVLPQILATARRELPTPDRETPAFAHLDQTWSRPELSPQPTVAVVDGTLRYVREQQTEQLFDRSGDPREIQDRSTEQPDELVRLRQIADRYLKAQPPWGETPTREIDELELNHLRALGYAIPGSPRR